MSNHLTVSKLKATVKAQLKSLGVEASLDPKPELRRSLYRRGEMLTEGQLRALVDKYVPVWVDYVDTNHHDCTGVFEVTPTDSESVMLQDGSCFALDFQFTGKDDALCYDEGYDGDPTAIFAAVRKKKK